MSADFKPVPLTKLPKDAHKHVRFVDGMVLGVDDFEQEFAYLSERDKLLVRMLGGYGVVRGLRVFAKQAGASGPEIVVSAGLAITPSGDVVRVPVDQCATIADWITGAGIELTIAGNEGVLTAYVTAEYATRTSDPVPIPGEPCRTESEVTADSRTADSFRLELSLTPVEHPDDLLIAAYLKWLESLPRTETGGTTAADIAAGAVRAAWEKSVAGNPPAPAAPFEPRVFGSHPRRVADGAALTLNRKDFLNAYLTGAERLCDVRALSAVLESSVTGSLQNGGDGKPQTRLLLAKIAVPVVRKMGTNVFLPKTADGSDIQFDTSLSPRLLSLQYLLKAALAGLRKVGESAVTQPRGDARYVVAAAGQIKVAANEAAAVAAPHSIGGLRAWANGTDKVVVAFEGLDLPSDRYVVKVLSSRHAGASTSACLLEFDAAKRSQLTLAITANPPVGSLENLGLSIEVGAVLD